MYYEETHINSCLKCKLCHKRLDKPNILPCGGIICTFCVLSINMANSTFKCQLCSSDHNYPDNGFPVCEPLVEILSAKPVEIQRSASFKLKQHKLNEMLKKIDQFRNKHKNGSVHIREYCSELRQKLKSSLDWSQQQLNQMYQDLCEQINQFEINSIQAYEIDKELKKEYSVGVSEVENLIKQFDLNDTDLANINELIDLMDREVAKLNQIVFKGNILKFEMSPNQQTKLDNSLIGYLAFETNF